jgi:hypothetical protein
MKQYIQIAREALKILEVNYSKEDNLDILLAKLKSIMIIPATQTEYNIQQLCLEIAKSIETKDDMQIAVLLDKLASEATYNLLD